MVDRLDGIYVGAVVDRSNSERLRGFGDGLTDGQTYAIVESLS